MAARHKVRAHATTLALLLGASAPADVPAQSWRPIRHVELIAATAAGAASDGVLRAVERTLQDRKLVDVTTAVINEGMGAPQIAYWEATLRKMAQPAEWKQMLEARTWVDRFAGAEGCKAALKYRDDQMRAGLLELGMAKN